MRSAFSFLSGRSGLRSDISRSGVREMAAIVVFVIVSVTAGAQAAPPPAPPPEPEEKVIGGYVTHQSLELGGHIVEQSGSGPMYNTLVNIHSGPRILNQSLRMRAKDLSHATFFDNLSTSSFGYGGDPINGTFLNVSKGRIYDFRGSFR